MMRCGGLDEVGNMLSKSVRASYRHFHHRDSSLSSFARYRSLSRRPSLFEIVCTVRNTQGLSW
jgi:hypothetical protein